MEAGDLPPGADMQFDLDQGDFPTDSEDGDFGDSDDDEELEEDTSGAETSEEETEPSKRRVAAGSDDDNIMTNIEGEEDMLDDEDDDDDMEEKFDLPTVEEREAEKVQGVGQGGLRRIERRLGELIRVLGDWGKLGGKDGR